MKQKTDTDSDDNNNFFIYRVLCQSHGNTIEIKGVNTSESTIITTIDGETKTLVPNSSKKWTIELDDSKTVSGKLVSQSGDVIFQGDITIKKDERISLVYN